MIHLGCDTDMHHFQMQNAWINPNTGGATGGITGRFKTYQVTGVTDSGTLTGWSSAPAYMDFKHGLLVGMYRYDW